MPAARHPRQAHERPPESSGLSAGGRVGKSRENLRELAGHRGIALLNDGLSCEGHFRTSSGRIAQLVEQLTLNQRVPGSSPGAPNIAKGFFVNCLRGKLPRTARVSCDVSPFRASRPDGSAPSLCFRSFTHSVRRLDPRVHANQGPVVEYDTKAR